MRSWPVSEEEGERRTLPRSLPLLLLLFPPAEEVTWSRWWRCGGEDVGGGEECAEASSSEKYDFEVA